MIDNYSYKLLSLPFGSRREKLKMLCFREKICEKIFFILLLFCFVFNFFFHSTNFKIFRFNSYQCDLLARWGGSGTLSQQLDCCHRNWQPSNHGQGESNALQEEGHRPRCGSTSLGVAILLAAWAINTECEEESYQQNWQPHEGREPRHTACCAWFSGRRGQGKSPDGMLHLMNKPRYPNISPCPPLHSLLFTLIPILSTASIIFSFC